MTYRGSHRAPSRASGCPLFDLTVNDVYPCDVYTHPHYYLERSKHDAALWRVIAGARCRPDALVTVYRGVPPGVRTINPGDWVALVRGYAADHALDLLGPGQDGVVISRTVLASDLFTNGDSLNEWGWSP